MSLVGQHGVTNDTAKNILFGAGTIHKGLTYTAGGSGSAGSWNFAATIIGATNGGSKLSIVPEITQIPIDGVLVATKGLSVKTGETATMDVNFTELTTDLITAATLGAAGTSEDPSCYSLIESKSGIVAGDYWDNVAFVGKTLDGRNIIAILPNVLVVNGFEQDGKSKEGTVLKCQFRCHAADLTAALDKLPWKIYYPVAAN